MVIIWSKKINDDVKYYIRKKKYKKILDDIESVFPDLLAGNFVGDKLEGFNLPEGAALYKVRIANTSANAGKSNSFQMMNKLQ